MVQDSAQSIVPTHLAVVMDGNGRWAQTRRLPRVAGHIAGVAALKRTVTYCLQNKIKILTVFAFSSENWHRPPSEVHNLMKLFLKSLKKEIKELHQRQIQLRFMGDLSRFSLAMQQEVFKATELTQNNLALTLVLAFNYGGRWDIFQAAKKLALVVSENKLDIETLHEAQFSCHLSMADLPEPDLFIRTSGEYRLSNFLLWQIAYTELYFCNVLWPDFSEQDLAQAILAFSARKRRYGKV